MHAYVYHPSAHPCLYHPAIHPLVYFSIHLSFRPNIHRSVRPSILQSVPRPFHPHIAALPSTHSPTRPLVYPSIHLFTDLSTHPSVYPSLVPPIILLVSFPRPVYFCLFRFSAPSASASSSRSSWCSWRRSAFWSGPRCSGSAAPSRAEKSTPRSAVPARVLSAKHGFSCLCYRCSFDQAFEHKWG